MPSRSGRFTPQEQAFADALARSGDKRIALKAAGYKSVRSIEKANDPAILAHAEAIRRDMLVNQALPLAMAAHLDLLRNGPAGVRKDLVKLTYDELRLLTGDQVQGKDLAEMTAEEIARQINALEIVKASMAVDITPADDSDFLA